MLLKRFLQPHSNLFAENRILKFAVVVLTIGFLWFAYRVEDVKDRVRTVIVPPVINSKVEISGSWTTDSYVKEYIRYIGSLLWNYSPTIARSQFSEVLTSWHPSVFEEAKSRMYILADNIELTEAASVFYVNKIEHNHDAHTIDVTGTRRLTQKDEVTESAVKTYRVGYKVENGRFWLTSVEEYDPMKASKASPADGKAKK